MLQKRILSHIKLYQSIILGIALAIGFTVIAFTEPAAFPPLNNVSAPVNIGPVSQNKADPVAGTACRKNYYYCYK